MSVKVGLPPTGLRRCAAPRADRFPPDGPLIYLCCRRCVDGMFAIDVGGQIFGPHFLHSVKELEGQGVGRRV